jgi:hypothetical protein
MDRTFAQLSIVAAILFLVIVLALMFLAPEVDALKYGISFYALTDFSAVIGVAIALVSLSAMFPGNRAMAQRVRRRSRRRGSVDRLGHVLHPGKYLSSRPARGSTYAVGHDPQHGRT